MAEEIKVEAKKETRNTKKRYFIKFLISFVLFWVLYDWLTLPNTAGVGIGVLFIVPFCIFIHVPLLIYSFYCFFQVFGRIAGAIFSILVIALIVSPSYIAEKHFEYLCAMAEPEAKLFPKIGDGDFVKELVPEVEGSDERSRRVARHRYGIARKKFLKEKFGIEDGSYSLLKDGRLLITKMEKPSYCSYANCRIWYKYLTDEAATKVVYKKNNTSLDCYYRTQTILKKNVIN